jgi:hypothetical protein
MDNDYLTLKRTSASRPSGQWSENDYDVLADGAPLSAHLQAQRSAHRKPVDVEDRTPTHGYEPTREAAMAAFAKSWRREQTP